MFTKSYFVLNNSLALNDSVDDKILPQSWLEYAKLQIFQCISISYSDTV